jgi:hypothetical protein
MPAGKPTPLLEEEDGAITLYDVHEMILYRPTTYE